MIPGTVITMGGKKYLLPPLNVAAMELHKDFLKKAAKGDIDPETAIDQIGTVAELVFLALKRNYPEITQAEVSEHVDFGNMADLLQNAFKTSGFEQSTGE